MGARERVRRVLAAAARVCDPGDPLHREALERLPPETGLSAGEVAEALALCVEREASEGELSSLLAWAPPERRVHVVLAGNVFVAAVRALALAWASAPSVALKPSRRGPVMPGLLLRALDEAGGEGEVALVDALAVAPGECVHAYGSDATIEAIGAALPAGARLWGHGHGLGVLVAEQEPPGAFLRDIELLGQQGCLSPRLLLLVAGEAAAAGHARGLAGALGARGWRHGADAGPRRAYVDAVAAVGEVFEAGGFVVGHQHEPAGLLLPPGPGVLHVVSVSSAIRARELLAPWARWVTCLGGVGAAADQVFEAVFTARRAAPGYMQRPPLDGPVDLRTRPPSAGVDSGA